MQIGNYSYMGSRDTNYVQTYPYFKPRDNENEYVIVYGAVNHQRTGKPPIPVLAFMLSNLKRDSEISLGTVNRCPV